MNRTQEIEARLDRSLATQIRVPKLGAQFDAAVWSRIEAEESRAVDPLAAIPDPALARAAQLSRWMLFSNLIGAAVAIVLAIYFGVRAFGGMDLGLNLKL